VFFLQIPHPIVHPVNSLGEMHALFVHQRRLVHLVIIVQEEKQLEKQIQVPFPTDQLYAALAKCQIVIFQTVFGME